MTLKSAVIGVGSMGRNHARIYWELPDVDFVGVADGDLAKAEAIAQRYGTKAYADYRTMLDEQKPDIVTVAVPTIYHLDVALDVISRGIHLLVEKPIAFNLVQGMQIVEAANKANVKLMVGHIERFNPAVIALKQHIADGELGRVFQIDAHRQGPFPARIGDVGVVIDLAVHDLDIMRYVTGQEIIRVYAETEHRIHSQHEDLLAGLVRMTDRIIGTLSINWLSPTKIRELLITGERGMFRVDYLTQDLYFFENSAAHTAEWENLRVLRGVGEGGMMRFMVNKKEPLRAEQEAFISAVLNNTPTTVNSNDALRALELAQAIVLSGQEQRHINVA